MSVNAMHLWNHVFIESLHCGIPQIVYRQGHFKVTRKSTAPNSCVSSRLHFHVGRVDAIRKPHRRLTLG